MGGAEVRRRRRTVGALAGQLSVVGVVGLIDEVGRDVGTWADGDWTGTMALLGMGFEARKYLELIAAAGHTNVTKFLCLVLETTDGERHKLAECDRHRRRVSAWNCPIYLWPIDFGQYRGELGAESWNFLAGAYRDLTVLCRHVVLLVREHMSARRSTSAKPPFMQTGTRL
jgi:hypothetical protein